MPTEIFTKSVDAEGNVSYTPVQNPLEVIENEAFFADARYKAVVDESIKRRQKIAALEAAQVQPEPVVVATPAPTPVAIDEELLYSNFRTRLETERKQEEARQAELRGLLTTHKLPEEALQILLTSANPSEAAALLGRSKFVFQGTNGGETTPTNEVPSIVAEMREDLGLE